MFFRNTLAGRRVLSALLCAGTALSPVSGFAATTVQTATPIQHVVVLFQENVSFDHYFGTYPVAANNPGETSFTGVTAPTFTAKSNTPGVNGLTPNLLLDNPNKDGNGNRANPFRLKPSQAYTCSVNHSYGPEQSDTDKGLQDMFPQNNLNRGVGCDAAGGTVMAYADGNMVTAYWNYAQHYAMNDNSYGTDFGPSSPGAINLISGNTYGGQLAPGTTDTSNTYTPTGGLTTELDDSDAYLDDCGNDKGGTVKTAATLQMNGPNIGDLLNAKGVTWGWFQGGFAPTAAATFNVDGSLKTPAVCGSLHVTHQISINGAVYSVPNPTINPGADIHTNGTDYVSHHEPFMFYASTRNPHHLRPTGPIGTTDQANHQYDTSDFTTALSGGSLPAVSFIKAPYYQNGHPGNSDPLLEQTWVVQMVNAIQQSPLWASTAIIIAYDDSDGWYDHVVPPNVRQSNILQASANGSDQLSGSGLCGTAPAGSAQGRCGFGPRLPLIVISPYAKTNYVDHTLTDQTSIMVFLEDNWGLGYIDGPTAPTYGTGSADRYAGGIGNMFDFVDAPNLRQLQLDPIKGTVVGKSW